MSPKNFPLSAYPEIIDAWFKADSLIGDGTEESIFMPVGTRGEAYDRRNIFQKVRAAIRAQKDEKDQFDYLIIRVTELGDLWGLEIQDRGLKTSQADLTFFNAKGESL